MNDQIVFNDEEAGAAIMRLAGGAVFNPKGEIAISRRINGKTVGGMVYGNHCHASIEMHAAGFRNRWLSRDLLWVGFAYPFEQLMVKKIFLRVQASNKASMRFTQHLGFTIESTLKDVYLDGDLHILSMYRDDCRHLNIKPRHIGHNQRPHNG